jgi:hypothetical protein|tara:strand:- start:208 stop:468 length:261 start_codon:yes stop_codon:yes gene_type:complete
MSDELKDQINEIIKDEIQEQINDYVDQVEKGEAEGFAKDEKLNVNISNQEINKIIKEYKKIKKSKRSNLHQVKKMGLVDKHGNPLK